MLCAQNAKYLSRKQHGHISRMTVVVGVFFFIASFLKMAAQVPQVHRELSPKAVKNCVYNKDVKLILTLSLYIKSEMHIFRDIVHCTY
jgi:hypothetical protein